MAASRDPGDASKAMFLRGFGAAAAMGAILVSTFAAPLAAAAAPRAVGDGLLISVVVPITAPWGEGGILDAATLATTTAPTGVLARELDEVLATTATVALDPMIPVSIRLLGAAAPESAVEWLDRLEAASNEVFLLAYADADLTSLARADALDLAVPLDLEFALDPAAFGPAETGTPTPDPSEPPTDDEPPPLPTTDELLGWPDAIGSIAWPAEGSVSAADIAAFDAAGYDAALLGSANLSAVSTARVEIDGVAGLVADATASALLREAAAAIESTARQDAVRRLGLELDRLATESPGRSVLLTLDRTPTFATPGLAEALGTVAAREADRVAGVSTVLADAPVPASVVETEPGPAIELAPTLTDALRAEQEFATILPDPMPLVAPRQLALLKLLTIQGLDADGWRADADAYLARSAEIRRSVTIVETGGVLVTSSNTSMPVRIANALDFPVTVRVDARPLRPLLRIDSPVDVTVEPASSAIVNLGAQAITNGEVVVEVSISSPTTGVQIGPTHRVDADLQAQWETVGIILGVVVALVFAAGIVRNVLLRRRAGRERDDETAGE